MSGCNRKIDSVFRILQKFVCKMYGETGDDVDESRLQMLIHKGKDFDNMPPTKDALYLHTLRSAHQCGNIWSFITQPSYIETLQSGVTRESDLREILNLFIHQSQSFREICPTWICADVKVDSAQGDCKCKKASQPCTKLCKCKLNCRKIAQS